MIFRNVFFNLRTYAAKHRWLILFIILLGIFRLWLITSGHRFWPDERRYMNALRSIKYIADGDFPTALSCLFRAHGRPVYILISMIPAGFQTMLSNAGILTANNPHFFDVPGMLNVLVSLSLSVLFYHILLILSKNDLQALSGTIIYSLLCNTNLYVRHLLPYDYSLLLFMVALYLILKTKTPSGLNNKMAINCGLLSSLAFLTYPGYYSFGIILAALIYVSAKNKIKTVFLYLSSAAAVVILFQTISCFADKTFFANLHKLSSTINQGSFEEGYVFIFRYMSTVEGLIGYALMALFSFYVIFLLLRDSNKLKILFLAVVLAYLCHGTLTVVFHKMVFYGRLIHMYVPFVVLGAMLALSHINNQRVRRAAILFMIVLSLISFVNFVTEYAWLSYPEDFAHRFIPYTPKKDICAVDELKKVKESDIEGYPFVTVNLKILYPIRKFFPLKTPPGMVLVKSVPHPLNFSAYAFESYSIIERERLRDRKYQMRIYKTSNDAVK